jgi:hypothetical protein
VARGSFFIAIRDPDERIYQVAMSIGDLGCIYSSIALNHAFLTLASSLAPTWRNARIRIFSVTLCSRGV